MEPLLVLDVNYLCHRVFHSFGELSWEGDSTGVLFGFLKSITTLKETFQTDRIAFCFDSSISLRRHFYPHYKKKRHAVERTQEQRHAYERLIAQMSDLRQKHLPNVGFKNVFCFEGMEADDILARIAEGVSDGQEMCLVTGDSDLFQCLRFNVFIYSPQKNRIFTDVWFIKEYGILPQQWALVKAIAGCPTDEVKGVGGVGEKTALKYVRGELPKDSKAYKVIASAASREIVRRNKGLVLLPLARCPVPVIVEDSVSRKAWQTMCDKLGMLSIAKKPPVVTRRLIRL